VKLRADISIEMEAGDYVEAAEHQKRVDEILSAIRRDYGSVTFSFRQARSSGRSRHLRNSSPQLSDERVRRMADGVCEYEE
jgi:hypothetical protein